MPGAHARLPPSGAHRWMRCAGSVQAEAGKQDGTAFHAAEGTALHEWAADCLELGLEPEDMLGAVEVVPSEGVEDEEGHVILAERQQHLEIDGLHTKARAGTEYRFVLDEEYARLMREGLETVRELASAGDLFVEVRVDGSEIVGEPQFGTSDVVVIDRRNKTMVIFDWKFGAGVPVSPEHNEQLMLYALMVWVTFAKDAMADIPVEEIDVCLIIEQPRAPGGGGEWHLPLEDLLAWEATVREAAQATREPNAVRTPGEKQCQFCKARTECGALSQYLLELAQSSFEDLDEAEDLDIPPSFPKPTSLTPAQKATVHRNASLFRKWLDDVHASIMHDYMSGRETPGLKLVIGDRGNRTWDDEDDAVMAMAGALGRAWSTRKLVSVAQAEKALGRTKFKALLDSGEVSYSQKEGKPVLVPSTDNRVGIERYADEFENLDSEAQ